MKKNIAIILIIVVFIFVSLWQKNVYENKVELIEIKIVELEEESSEISLLNEELSSELKASNENYLQLESDELELINELEEISDLNNDLASGIEEVEDELLSIEYEMIQDNLPNIWEDILDNIYMSDGELTDEQIDEINYLLQPVFTYDNQMAVNPLSCFFTSYYEDVRDINLTSFLRYFPYGEVPEELPELEELENLENWPFQVGSLDSMPVPIHRYMRVDVQNIMMIYSGISLNELSGIGFDMIAYLESTDAYYNYTSDFGPGVFTCTEGIVEDGEIRLYGSSISESSSVLTIVKDDENYIIKSFYVE
jgi:hypothetical protein